MQIRYSKVQETSPTFICHFYTWQNVVYTFLCLITLITLITLSSLKTTFSLSANNINNFDILFEFFWVCMNFLWIFKLLVKGHSKSLEVNIRANWESQKVRTKPVGKFRREKMQLSLLIVLYVVNTRAKCTIWDWNEYEMFFAFTI